MTENLSAIQSAQIHYDLSHDEPKKQLFIKCRDQTTHLVDLKELSEYSITLVAKDTQGNLVDIAVDIEQLSKALGLTKRGVKELVWKWNRTHQMMQSIFHNALSKPDVRFPDWYSKRNPVHYEKWLKIRPTIDEGEVVEIVNATASAEELWNTLKVKDKEGIQRAGYAALKAHEEGRLTYEKFGTVLFYASCLYDHKDSIISVELHTQETLTNALPPSDDRVNAIELFFRGDAESKQTFNELMQDAPPLEQSIMRIVIKGKGDKLLQILPMYPLELMGVEGSTKNSEDITILTIPSFSMVSHLIKARFGDDATLPQLQVSTCSLQDLAKMHERGFHPMLIALLGLCEVDNVDGFLYGAFSALGHDIFHIFHASAAPRLYRQAAEALGEFLMIENEKCPKNQQNPSITKIVQGLIEFVDVYYPLLLENIKYYEGHLKGDTLTDKEKDLMVGKLTEETLMEYFAKLIKEAVSYFEFMPIDLSRDRIIGFFEQKMKGTPFNLELFKKYYQ